ncbi:MAG TPA: efflux RND transporter periplasmic adaptor subunit [Pyrinomonadaceae bacterium]|nr:efflux RND transporter periplasmic adaptor subunit [Pyrinomonadaceae bacterium]
MQLYKKTVFANLVVIFSLILSACGGGSKAETSNANTNANSAPSIVDTTTTAAILRDVPTYFEATGNLASDAQTDVAPTVGGKITQVNFDIGSYVNKGDVLIRLDDRDARIRLEQAEAQYEQAKSQLNQAQANVDQAIANLRQAQIRLGVKDGEIFDINKFSQVKSVTAQLELAEKELARATRLLETGDISRSIYDQRKSQRDALLGQLDEARSNAAVAVRAINTAEAAVNTAKTGVGNARAALGTAQTNVDQAKKNLGDTVVYAPISGYISERNSDVGEFISPNVPNSKIATIVRTSVLRLRIDVPEQNVAQIAVGQGISMQTSAYPDRNFAGTVVRISPSINATSRILVVEAEVENSGGLLKPGQFATVRITQGKGKQAVMIPKTAVKTEGETTKVFVIKDGRATERTVKVGILENDLIEIQNGVQEGESVATSNVNVLYDGVAVRQ